MSNCCKQERLIPFFLVLSSFLLFWQTMGFDFVWDDNRIHLADNPYLNPPTMENLVRIWTATYKGLYIPAAYTAWGGLKLIATRFFPGSDGAALLHFVNIVLHSCNGVLVFLLLKRFINSPFAAGAGAFLFIVHPIQVEAVTWISEFRGLAAAALVFSGVLVHIRGCDSRHVNGRRGARIVYDVIVFLLFSMAILFKPSAVVMPLFMVIAECHLFGKIRRQSVFLMAIMAVPVLMVMWITSAAQETPISVPIWGKLLIWMDAVNFYLYKLSVPFSLAASYARTPAYVLSLSWTYFLWVIPPALMVAVLYCRKKCPPPATAAGFFLAGFLPVSGLVPFFFQRWSTTSDRYLYLSMLGTALFFAWLTSLGKRRWQFLGCWLYLLFLAGWSGLVQAPVWQNNITLWEHCIRKTPREPMAYINRGQVYLREKNYLSALADFTNAIELDAGYEEAYVNRGIIYAEKGQNAKAMADYNRAAKLNPEVVALYNNRGLLHLRQKEYSRAKDDFLKALVLDPGNALVLNSLGSVYNETNDQVAALENFNKAILSSPGYPDPYYNRGRIRLARKKPGLALADFAVVIRLNPGYENAYIHMAAAHQQMGHVHRAVQAYESVLKINPGSLPALVNKGVLLIQMGRHKEAVPLLTRAVEIDPGSRLGYFHRGNARHHGREYEKAVEDYSRAIALDPKMPEVLNNRAAAYYQLKEFDKAVADMRAVRQLGGKINPKLERLLERKVDSPQ